MKLSNQGTIGIGAIYFITAGIIATQIEALTRRNDEIFSQNENINEDDSHGTIVGDDPVGKIFFRETGLSDEGIDGRSSNRRIFCSDETYTSKEATGVREVLALSSDVACEERWVIAQTVSLK